MNSLARAYGWGWMVPMVGLLLAAGSAQGQVLDSDLDFVPDLFDNCMFVANGPAETSNQVDTDLDGYGNVCDTDYNNDGSTTTLDFSTFLNAFAGSAPDLATDHNGDFLTTTLDFSTFLSRFSSPPGAPGPSGLPCAGFIPCLP